jgi:hypothetical protein
VAIEFKPNPGAGAIAPARNCGFPAFFGLKPDYSGIN